MRASEFLKEGVDTSPADVQQNHPEIYNFVKSIMGHTPEKATVVSFNLGDKHLITLNMGPTAGLNNTRAILKRKGIGFDNKSENELIGEHKDLRFTIREEHRGPGNKRLKWTFEMPKQIEEADYDPTLDADAYDFDSNERGYEGDEYEQDAQDAESEFPNYEDFMEDSLRYGVFSKGGSIGGDKSGEPIKTFDNKDEALADARRRRKGLSKGEKQYYKMGYTVRPIKSNKVTEADDIPPNANHGEIEVSVAGYRAQQNPTATHGLKVWMNKYGGKQMTKNRGDAYVWQVDGITVDEMLAMVQSWYGNMQDINVTISPTPRPMRKVGMNWSYNMGEADEEPKPKKRKRFDNPFGPMHDEEPRIGQRIRPRHRNTDDGSRGLSNRDRNR